MIWRNVQTTDKSPKSGGVPHLQHSQGENSPQVSGLPWPWKPASVGHPTFHVKAIKKKRTLYEEIGYPIEAGHLTFQGFPTSMRTGPKSPIMFLGNFFALSRFKVP